MTSNRKRPRDVLQSDEQTALKNTSCRHKCRHQIDVSEIYLCY